MTNELAYHSNRARIDELFRTAEQRSLLEQAGDGPNTSLSRPATKPSLRFMLRRLREAVA